jgi:hypothetical protein
VQLDKLDQPVKQVTLETLVQRVAQGKLDQQVKPAPLEKRVQPD